MHTFPRESSANALVACYVYAFQIYCDFYGYTLIAIGSAALLGIELVNNFDHPYLAPNLQAFWSRWHISLTTWLRDYIYFPLGGLRKPILRYRNLMITWLVAGLWHGSGLTFILWGLIHGIGLCAYHFYRSLLGNRTSKNVIAQTLGAILTFHFVVLAWIPFRSASFADMRIMFAKLSALPVTFAASPPSGAYFVFLLRLAIAFVILEIADWSIEFESVYLRAPVPIQAAWLAICASALYFAPLNDVRFIYFQF